MMQLKDWADAILMAPMSANTLAKIANGLSDNLLVRATSCRSMRLFRSTHSCFTFVAQTCIARAWSTKKPFFYAPAMNTDMWDHPVTARHLKTLTEFGYQMIPPVEKMLACGVVGTYRAHDERETHNYCGVGLFESTFSNARLLLLSRRRRARCCRRHCAGHEEKTLHEPIVTVEPCKKSIEAT